MARDLDSKCKRCRRAGEKLFLKGERCFSPKCAMVRKNYPPGVHGKKVARNLSEYGRQLAVKQKVKRIYGVLEKQFKKHFDEVMTREGVTGDLLMQRLEMRLDNVIYRAGWADSRSQARQLVSHNFFTVNNKKMNIPSYEVKEGDMIKVKKNKEQKKFIKSRQEFIQNKKDLPAWMVYDESKNEVKILKKPNIDDIGIKVDAQLIVEFYSR